MTRHLYQVMQYTLAILKPDISSNSIAREAIFLIAKEHGFKVICSKKTTLSLEMAKRFYAEHSHKFFFTRLVTFMSSSPIYVAILSKEDAIQSWRSLIGPASVYRNIYDHPSCLRARFGLTDTRNALHGSSSCEDVTREVEFFFPRFKLDSYTSTDSSKIENSS